MKSLKNLCLTLCIILFLSCSQSLDFDQIEDYTATPSFSTALTFFTISSGNFVTVAGMPVVTEIEEKTDFKLFEKSLIRDNIVRLVFNFEFINSFNRDFIMEISLLDENDISVYNTIVLSIKANEKDTLKEDIDITANQNVKNFTKAKIVLRLEDPTIPILANEVGSLVFKSGATIYLETSL